jgi:threonine synthase
MRGKKNIQVFILYPQGKVSPIQELQMTSILDPNVHCLAVINSTFDDAQNIVKSVFGQQEFKKRHNISAVNSINWARILAQIVYYFHAYYQLVRENSITLGQKVNFSVPTGNFGDILAGKY